jgi:hypothetical protein
MHSRALLKVILGTRLESVASAPQLTPNSAEKPECTGVHEDFEHCLVANQGRAVRLQTGSQLFTFSVHKPVNNFLNKS